MSCKIFALRNTLSGIETTALAVGRELIMFPSGYAICTGNQTWFPTWAPLCMLQKKSEMKLVGQCNVSESGASSLICELNILGSLLSTFASRFVPAMRKRTKMHTKMILARVRLATVWQLICDTNWLYMEGVLMLTAIGTSCDIMISLRCFGRPCRS